MLRSLCILGAGALCLMVRNDRLPDCPFVASIKGRLHRLDLGSKCLFMSQQSWCA